MKKEILAGLGWFDAHVKRFDEEQLHDCKHLPHMGWNDVDPVNGSGLFKGLNDSARFIFSIPITFIQNSRQI